LGAGAAAGAGLGAAGAEGAAGDERLNAEFKFGEVMGCLGAEGAGAGAGMDRSRRSSRPEEVAAGLEAVVVGEVKEEKSPNPPVLVRFCGCAWVAGAGFEEESKKLPPPPKILEDVEGGDRVLE
jgi:hypothetical protein